MSTRRLRRLAADNQARLEELFGPDSRFHVSAESMDQLATVMDMLDANGWVCTYSEVGCTALYYEKTQDDVNYRIVLHTNSLTSGTATGVLHASAELPSDVTGQVEKVRYRQSFALANAAKFVELAADVVDKVDRELQVSLLENEEAFTGLQQQRDMANSLKTMSTDKVIGYINLMSEVDVDDVMFVALDEVRLSDDTLNKLLALLDLKVAAPQADDLDEDIPLERISDPDVHDFIAVSEPWWDQVKCSGRPTTSNTMNDALRIMLDAPERDEFIDNMVNRMGCD